MKSFFTSLLLAATVILVRAAPEPAPELLPFSARELAQGFRQYVILARPARAHGATVDADEAREGIRIREKFPRIGDLRVIELDDTDDATGAIERLRATGRYAFVESDRILQIAVEPNDPQFANGALWAMKNSGLSNGVAGADISATAAWDVIREAPNVVVAIIDTGLNINHQDLAGNIWQNPSPTFGDITGARFINGGRSGNIADDSGHGTHVAGTIGAVGNNGIGVAGVAWRVQLMPVKVFTSSGLAATSDIVTGINYAIVHGAQIINGSYGDSGDTGFSQSQLAAIEAARAAGIIFVAAAGNSAANIDTAREYPASHALDNIVTVGNSTRQDTVALSSNFGATVDLFAPGSDIVSLDSASNTGTRTLSGTSMSAPHVAGALVLLKARFPNDTYRQLINRLLRGVDRRDRFTGKAQTGGRLDVYNALITDSNRPFNDRFADRARLTGNNLSLRSNNLDATMEAGEAPHAGVAASASLWWEWTPSTSGSVTIDTTGSGQDTVIAIYTSASGGPPFSPAELTLVTANDDDPTTPVTTSRLSYTAQAGVPYYIAVASKNGSGGMMLLNIGTTAPNDFFSGAQVVEGESARVTSQNAHCSIESAEPRIAGWVGGNSLWYRWTAPQSGRFQFAAVSDEFDPIMGVFTGSAVNSLTLVAENDNATGSAIHTGSLCTIEAIGGTTYAIVVEAKNPTLSGQFTLTVVDSLWQAVTGDNLTGSPAVANDGTLYVGSTDGGLYAFTAAGGRKWSVLTGGYIDSSSPAVANDGTVIVGSNDGKVYAYSSEGINRWISNLGSLAPVSTSPAIAADGTIYIKAGDGYLYALEPATGAVRWRCDVHGPDTYASPSIAPDGTIYQGSDDSKLYAVTPAGTVKWTFSAGQDIYTVPAIDAAGNVYFGVLITGELFSVSPAGVLRWRYGGAALGSSSSPALSADGGTVYFGGYDHKLHAVNAATGAPRWTYQLGDEVRASSPAVDASGVIYIGCYDSKLYAIHADGTLKRTYDTGDWIRSSPAIAGTTLYVGSNDSKLYAFDLGVSAGAGPWPMYRQNPRRLGRASPPPTITAQPASQGRNAGDSVTFSTAATGTPSPSYQWQRNGSDVAGATSATLTLDNLQPANAGLYTTTITNGTPVFTEPAVLGVLTAAKVIGAASEFRADIVHQNGNVYDQVLLAGAAASMTADPGQIVRLSYVDLSNDIVQVEFSGAGTLSIALDNASGPAVAQSYVQPGVSYMKGHASIVIAGADETTNVSVFSVGRITAVDQSLFRADVTYDGIADIAYLAILSRNGRFGGIRTGNTSYFSTRSLTGIYAPGVQFTGPVLIGDLSATDAATPVLLLGSASDISVTGGDLFQPNGRAVRISGVSALRFTAGTTSHGTLRPAQSNQARLEQDGAEVTGQVVVNPGQ